MVVILTTTNFVFSSSDSYSFYLNGVLQDSSPTVSGVFFDLTTSPVSGGTPFLYVGGIPATELNLPGLEAVSSFHGCMKDLAFNFRYGFGQEGTEYYTNYYDPPSLPVP